MSLRLLGGGSAHDCLLHDAHLVHGTTQIWEEDGTSRRKQSYAARENRSHGSKFHHRIYNEDDTAEMGVADRESGDRWGGGEV